MRRHNRMPAKLVTYAACILSVLPVALLTDTSAAQARVAGAFGAPAQWSASIFPGDVAVLAQDVDHDGDADLIGINRSTKVGIQVMQKVGPGFTAPRMWQSPGLWGTRANLSGDLNADRNGDLVVVTDYHVWTTRSAASMSDLPGFFTQPYRAYLKPFAGNVTTLLGDVDADGDSDVIRVDTLDTVVMRSNGYSFANPSGWTLDPTVGSRVTLGGDVDGDRDTDIIAVDDAGVRIMAANRTRFLPAVQWSTESFYGRRKTLAADATGDGLTDLIAVDDTGVRVMPSTGTGFAAPQQWSTEPVAGTRATLAADVDADGDGDLIAVNDADTWVTLAQ